MIKVLYFTSGQGQPFFQRMEICPPRIGERIKFYENQNVPEQKRLYAVEDVTTPLALWLPSGQEVKEILLREIAISGEVIMGDQGAVENVAPA